MPIRVKLVLLRIAHALVTVVEGNRAEVKSQFGVDFHVCHVGV